MARRNVWKYNFAKDVKIRDRVKGYFCRKTTEVRDQRQDLEEEWMGFYNMWDVTFDDNHLYEGRARLYIPQVRKDVEAQARQMTESAFPNQNYFDVVPGDTGTRRGAIVQKNIRKHQIQQCNLRLKFHVYARQAAMLGTSPVFVPWKVQEENVFRSQIDKGTKKVRVRRAKEEIYRGPDFQVRDLFRWYPFNSKKQDILEDGCFEYLLASENDLIRLNKAGNLVNASRVLQGQSDASLETELEKDVRRYENMGLSVGAGGFAGVATLKPNDQTKDKVFKRTVIYTKIQLPEALEPDEDPQLPIPVYMEIINNEHVTVIRRNQFFHQRPPYLVGRYVLPNADQFYGQGIPKATQYMQYEINSKAEQAMDSATLALNPITIVDPGMAHQTSDFTVEPGALWLANPAGIELTKMPDVSAVGYQAVALIRQQMSDFSDRAPALPPQLLGKSRTATQANIVNAASQIDAKTFQMINEALVLNPLMEMWESLTDQNITEDQVIMILGNQSREWRRALVTKTESLGRYRYFWKVSSSLMDKAVLGRSIIDMLKVSALIPPEDKMKMNINYPEIYRMLWNEAFQLPDADRLFGSRDQEATTPELEHKMLEMGLDLEVLPGDEDGEHLETHRNLLEKTKNKRDIKLLEEHMNKHRASIKFKIEEQKAQLARQQAIIAQIASQKGGGSGGGQRQGVGGNRTQLSQNATSGNVASGIR